MTTVDERPESNAVRALGSASGWMLAVSGCWLLGLLGSLISVPAPYLVASALAGALLAGSGLVCRSFPRRPNIAAQALIGSFMGSFIDLGAVRASGEFVLIMALAMIATILLCLAAGWFLPRLTRIDPLDAVLGMAPGNPSAIVGMADELDADPCVVAFVQYLRAAIVAASIPLTLVLVGRSAGAGAGPDDSSGLAGEFRLIASGHQIAGVACVLALCAGGYILGRLVRLPVPAIVGPLVLSAVIPQSVNESCSPSELLRNVMFVVVGLEVGLRFQRSALQAVWQLVPRVAAVTVLVALISGLVACAVSAAAGVPFVDTYLALAPGGLNPIMASTVSSGADILLVASTQTVRLLVTIVIAKSLGRWLAARRAG